MLLRNRGGVPLWPRDAPEPCSYCLCPCPGARRAHRRSPLTAWLSAYLGSVLQGPYHARRQSLGIAPQPPPAALHTLAPCPLRLRSLGQCKERRREGGGVTRSDDSPCLRSRGRCSRRSCPVSLRTNPPTAALVSDLLRYLHPQTESAVWRREPHFSTGPELRPYLVEFHRWRRPCRR